LVEGEGFLPDGISEKREHELREDARSMLGEKQISIDFRNMISCKFGESRNEKASPIKC